MRVRWILPIFVCAACAQTLDLPRAIPQGSTLRIRRSASAVAARMNNRTIRLFPQADGRSVGLMPVPADAKPGDYKIELLDKGGTTVASVPIRVLDAHFPRQNVVIGQNLAELKPSPGETEAVTAFRTAVSEVRYWSEPLALPVRGCMTSPLRATVHERQANRKPPWRVRSAVTCRHAGATVKKGVVVG